MRQAEHGEKEPKKFGVREITTWMSRTAGFHDIETLTNSHRLSKYMSARKMTIAKAAGIHEAGAHNNRRMYDLRPIQTVEHGIRSSF